MVVVHRDAEPFPRIDKSAHTKCVLCEEYDSANYKGCSVYKETQSKKYPALRPQQTINNTQTTTPKTGQKKSYSRPEQAINTQTGTNVEHYSRIKIPLNT